MGGKYIEKWIAMGKLRFEKSGIMLKHVKSVKNKIWNIAFSSLSGGLAFSIQLF